MRSPWRKQAAPRQTAPPSPSVAPTCALCQPFCRGARTIRVCPGASRRRRCLRWLRALPARTQLALLRNTFLSVALAAAQDGHRLVVHQLQEILLQLCGLRRPPHPLKAPWVTQARSPAGLAVHAPSVAKRRYARQTAPQGGVGCYAGHCWQGAEKQVQGPACALHRGAPSAEVGANRARRRRGARGQAERPVFGLEVACALAQCVLGVLEAVKALPGHTPVV